MHIKFERDFTVIVNMFNTLESLGIIKDFDLKVNIVDGVS